MVNKKFAVLPIAIILLILGLLVGLSRYTRLYGFNVIALDNLFLIHPHIIIFGFISILIFFERYMGVGLTRGVKQLLIIGILFNIFAIILLVLGSFIRQQFIVDTSLKLFFIPPILYIIFLFTVGSHLYKPVLAIHLTANLMYILAIYISLEVLDVDRYLYSLILLLYPLLFILGERIELTRFVLPSRNILTVMYLSISLLILIVSASIFEPKISRYLGFLIGLPLMAIILSIVPLDPTLKIERMEGRMGYLRHHLAVGYLMLMFGILAYYLGMLFTEFPINFYDIYIHLIALGFIGFMLVGHGPIILSSILNVNVEFSMLPSRILLISLALRILLDIIYSMTPAFFNWALSFISSILVFVALVVFIRKTVLHGLLERKGSI